MTASPLCRFISLLESTGELSRISVSVDPSLEIAAVTDRICKRPGGGPALLFEHPAGSAFALGTNLFGSEKRVCLALGISALDELTARLQTLLDQIPGFDISALDRQLAALPEFGRLIPRDAPHPDPDLVTMDPPNLNLFPFLHSWPGDGAAAGHPRYITLPQVITAGPDGGTPNCGLYRVQLRGEREAAIQWKTGSGAARHAELYRQTHKEMPVAIVLGGDPALLFSAMFPIPGNLDEVAFAGFLRGTPVVTSPCTGIPLRVPSGAEVVIEGYVDPVETVIEGPFGNHTGFYSPAAPAALMRITAVRHRRDAVIPATVVGPPPMEDCWMAQAWARLLLALLQKTVPAIKDIRFPNEWVFHQSAIISLENPQPGMVRNISETLWALPWFASARILLFVTHTAGGHTLSSALWKAINTADSSDIIHDRATGRSAVDATGCRLPRPKVDIATESAILITRRWKEYGIE